MALRTLLPAQNGAGSGDMHVTPHQDVSVLTRSVDHGASDETVRKQAEMSVPPRDAEIRAQNDQHDHSAQTREHSSLDQRETSGSAAQPSDTAERGSVVSTIVPIKVARSCHANSLLLSARLIT
jgi:hypothetical protein